MNKEAQKYISVPLVLLMVLSAAILVMPGAVSANAPPVADAEPDYQEVWVGNYAWFWGNNSYDPDGNITIYYWDFGDGNHGYGEVVYNIYYSPGTYNVTLTVYDDMNGTDIDTVVIVVFGNTSNDPPVAYADPKYQIVSVGVDAWFSGNLSYDPDGIIVYYLWDFGDGSSMSGIYLTHAYSAPGSYNATLTVTDDQGATDMDAVIVHVTGTPTNEPPVAVAYPDWQTVNVGEDAWFSGNMSYDSDGYIVSYEWDFGDGGNGSSGIYVTHAYAAPGNYTVTLTVTDNEGATDTDTVIVYVTSVPINEPPIAVASPDEQTMYVGEDAWFSGNMSYDPDGTIVSYEWDFGDGSTGSGIYVTHAYSSPGNYTVTLTVKDNQNATDTDSCIVIVSVPPDPLPPRDMDAELVKGALSDVRITWTGSLDDGAGEDDIAGYTVYKSQTGVNGLYEATAWIPALGIPDNGYEWVDSGAGDGNWNNYFYIIRAKDVLDKEEQNIVKVGKFASLLDEGWNMISVPLIQKDTSREVVLQTIDGNYVAVQGYHAGKSRPWLKWHRDKPNYFNDAIEIDHKNGYYIDMLVSDYLVTAGRVAAQENIALKSGWNLVGYPCLTDKTVAEALSSIAGNYNKVEKYDTAKDREVRLLDTDLMVPGLGYWIHVTNDCVWTPTN